MGVVGFICFSSSIQAASNTQLNLEPDEVKSNVVTPNVQESFTLSKSVPVTIQIPAIGLDLPVRAVGQSADGSIATPDVLKYEAGWYQYSPTPGEKGPAVIVGHVDNYKGPSVFWRLRELKPEDTIKVTRTDGTVANFMVLSLEQFEQDRLPIQKLYGDTDYASLRLITCGGIFNRQSGQYTHNTVVFAKMSNDSSPVVR
jgi:LPXTG-site transpeptidase (sortase) family protein